MADIVSQTVRRRMMAGIKSRNTKPEILIRKQLHGMGFRFRLHDKHLVGKPDIVFAKYRAIIFIHGCFWHGHGCRLFKWPSSNEEFWRTKITSNMERDIVNKQQLQASGWRVAVIWECAIRKSGCANKELAESLAAWLTSDTCYLEIGD